MRVVTRVPAGFALVSTPAAYVLAVLLLTFATSCNPADPENAEATSQAAAPVISGVPDATNVYGAVAAFTTVGCSAVLVARRAALTSAHCVPIVATRCASYVPGALALRFAEPDGSVVAANVANRIVAVQSLAVHPDAALDVSLCATGDACAENTLDCAEFNPSACPFGDVEAPNSVNRSSEMVVLYLAADAPADVVPLPILVHPTFVSLSPAFASFAGLESWAAQQQPLLTIVGYGVGSDPYPAGRGRDMGVSRWRATQEQLRRIARVVELYAEKPAHPTAGCGRRPG